MPRHAMCETATLAGLSTTDSPTSRETIIADKDTGQLNPNG
jgi:hypothetical protein